MAIHSLASRSLLSVLVLLAGASLANAGTISFLRNSSNNVEDIAPQLCLDLSVDGGVATFTFTNNVGVDSSLTDIYFRSTLSSEIDFSSAQVVNDGTNFELGASPPKVPGDFSWGRGPASGYIGFASDVDNVQNGVNSSQRSVSYRFALLSSEASLVSAIGTSADVSDSSIGLHVQSIGQASGSDWFHNGGGGGGIDPEPIPEPATLALLGVGAAGVAAFRRRRHARGR